VALSDAGMCLDGGQLLNVSQLRVRAKEPDEACAQAIDLARDAAEEVAGAGRSRVHGTIQATRLHADVCFAAEGATVDRPSLAIKAFQHMTGHSYQRVPADRLSCRSRNFDTAFRSLATTLSPPLRGQRS
jgi:hypothetical protein